MRTTNTDAASLAAGPCLLVSWDTTTSFPIIVKSPASPEQLAIQKLYVAYFGRPAEVAGFEFWKQSLATGKMTMEGIAAEFANSVEYTAMFRNPDGTEMSAADSVALVYTNLFGRPAELAGLAYWSAALANKQVTIADIVLAVAAGAQGSDLVAINCKVLGAHYFTSSFVTASDVLSYHGPQAIAAARAYIQAITDEASLEAGIGKAPPIRIAEQIDIPFYGEAPLWDLEPPAADTGSDGDADAGLTLVGMGQGLDWNV